MYELFSNLVFFFGNNFVDIRISDITELFRNEVNAEANFIGDTENHSRKGGNMSASQLATNWICIATAGETVDKRAIEEQWLLDAAELYDPSLYTALLWPEHSRNFGNMGEVLELKAERDDEGILRLYARLCPGISLLQANANGQLLFLSPEFTPDGNFRNTGKTYLEGLAVTDSPAGVSTTRLRFSRTKGKRIGPYKPLAFDEVREFKKEKGMSKTAKKGWRHFFSIEEPEATAEQETSQPDALPGVWRWILTCLLTASTRPAQRITCRWANTGSHWAAAGAGASNPGRTAIISVWNMTGFADGSCGGGLACNGCSGLLGRLEGG